MCYFAWKIWNCSYNVCRFVHGTCACWLTWFCQVGKWSLLCSRHRKKWCRSCAPVSLAAFSWWSNPWCKFSADQKFARLLSKTMAFYHQLIRREKRRQLDKRFGFSQADAKYHQQIVHVQQNTRHYFQCHKQHQSLFGLLASTGSYHGDQCCHYLQYYYLHVSDR